jgi:hypothetical protein
MPEMCLTVVAVAAMLVVGRGSTMARVEEVATAAAEEATMGGVGWGYVRVYLFLPGGTVGYPAQPGLTWRNRELPNPTKINSFLHL